MGDWKVLLDAFQCLLAFASTTPLYRTVSSPYVFHATLLSPTVHCDVCVCVHARARARVCACVYTLLLPIPLCKPLDRKRMSCYSFSVHPSITR